jgi:hypothetical protein
MKPDRFINLLVKFASALYVMGRKPATDAFGL